MCSLPKYQVTATTKAFSHLPQRQQRPQPRLLKQPNSVPTTQTCGLVALQATPTTQLAHFKKTLNAVSAAKPYTMAMAWTAAAGTPAVVAAVAAHTIPALPAAARTNLYPVAVFKRSQGRIANLEATARKTIWTTGTRGTHPLQQAADAAAVAHPLRELRL